MKPLYAILHKPTGFYLPEPTGREGRGGSHTEPVNCIGDVANPRLFTTERSASNALTQWLRGKHFRYTETEGSYEEGYYEVDGPLEVAHQPHRKREEMEIVPFFLVRNIS